MKKFALVMLAGLAIAGCTDKGGDTGDTSGTDGGAGDGGGTGDGGGSGDWYVDANWDSAGITVDVTNGNAAGYDFGMAETNGDAYAWTGEDCGYQGYTANDGTYYEFCHDFGATGGTLTTVVTFEDVIAGSTTIMHSGLEISYYLYDVASGACYTWGDDTTYFYDCTDASSAVGGNW